MHTLPLLFNDVDGYEVLVIILVVLIFFGPKSIPGIAKTLGKALYSIRNATNDLKDEIRKSGVDVKKDLNIEQLLKQQEEQLIQPMDQVFTDIGNTMHYEGNKVNSIIAQNQEVSDVVVENETYGKVLYRQIAGALAKRIANYAKVDNKAIQGGDSGFIKFGSRVDLFLPIDTNIKVKLNQKVRGGESIIAEL